MRLQRLSDLSEKANNIPAFGLPAEGGQAGVKIRLIGVIRVHIRSDGSTALTTSGAT